MEIWNLNNLKYISMSIKVSQTTISSINRVNNTTKLCRINSKFTAQQRNVSKSLVLLVCHTGIPASFLKFIIN